MKPQSDLKRILEHAPGMGWGGQGNLDDAIEEILKLVEKAEQDKTEKAILFLADCIDSLENIKDTTVISRRQAAEEILREEK